MPPHRLLNCFLNSLYWLHLEVGFPCADIASAWFHHFMWQVEDVFWYTLTGVMEGRTCISPWGEITRLHLLESYWRLRPQIFQAWKNDLEFRQTLPTVLELKELELFFAVFRELGADK